MSEHEAPVLTGEQRAKLQESIAMLEAATSAYDNASDALRRASSTLSSHKEMTVRLMRSFEAERIYMAGKQYTLGSGMAGDKTQLVVTPAPFVILG